MTRIADKLKKNGKKIIFTNGCFDLLHVGHVNYLKKARLIGDILVVGINDDKSTKRLKGSRRPIMPVSERAKMLSAIRWVDYIVLFGENNPEKLILAIKPNIHVKGGDYKNKKIPEAKILFTYGGKQKITSYIKGRSSSEIIHTILKRYHDSDEDG